MPSAYLKQIYFDTLVYSSEHLRHLIEVVGADRLVIGTDFPFNMSKKDAIDHLLSVSNLTADEREAVLGRTAAGLLGIS